MSDARATLPRSVRLRGAAQFTGAFQRRYSTKHFLLMVRPGGSPEGDARLGIVIGRRQLPRAVDRSHLRRIIREAFRHRRQQLGRVDAVVRYRSAAGQQDTLTIRSELDELFGRVAR